MKPVLLDLYVITDEGLSGGRSHTTIAAMAVAGGADAIQLRDKTRSIRDLVRIGREISRITKPAGVPLIINDRLDVALACGADGVHLGQGDLRTDIARQLVPAFFIIGVSVGSVEEALLAENRGADYIALSPIFDTVSKADAGRGYGLERLREIRAAVSIPVIAIGGVGPGNAGEVIRAGADGIAVISAVVSAPDITRAVQDLRSQVLLAKRERLT